MRAESWLSTPQAAELLCVSRDTVWRMALSKRLTYRRIGRNLQISKASVEALINTSTVPEKSHAAAERVRGRLTR